MYNHGAIPDISNEKVCNVPLHSPVTSKKRNCVAKPKNLVGAIVGATDGSKLEEGAELLVGAKVGVKVDGGSVRILSSSKRRAAPRWSRT